MQILDCRGSERQALSELLRQRRIERRVEDARRRAERSEHRRIAAKIIARRRRERREQEMAAYGDRVRARRLMAGLVESQDRGLAGRYIR